jgi:hypothetical protein
MVDAAPADKTVSPPNLAAPPVAESGAAQRKRRQPSPNPTPETSGRRKKNKQKQTQQTLAHFWSI